MIRRQTKNDETICEHTSNHPDFLLSERGRNFDIEIDVLKLDFTAYEEIFAQILRQITILAVILIKNRRNVTRVIQGTVNNSLDAKTLP